MDRTNISVGLLGHVDSGKTSLCKRLSTTASTAAFDSNPQSQLRGITLDLGFSSFQLDKWNITLVDCPGHSSLMRTVIGGAQIMDMVFLVVDLNKGMQAQTAECLILAQITTPHLVVLLNKVDLVPIGDRTSKIAKVSKLMRGVLQKTKFSQAPILPVSATDPDISISSLRELLGEELQKLEIIRDTKSPFLMAIDHCFTIKGQGTILTGTVLQGSAQVNDMIELPSIKETKKIKSIQSFKIPVNEARAGDRVGICVGGLDATLIERTIISAPNQVRTSVRVVVLSFEKITYFKKQIKSNTKFHISIGYETVTARVILFKSQNKEFEFGAEYEYVPGIPDTGQSPEHSFSYFALIEFDNPVMAVPKSLVIGSDFQTEEQNICRLAFCGYILDFTEDKAYMNSYLQRIKILRPKEKRGVVDRIHDETTLIAKGFCKRESKIEHLLNLKVQVRIEGLEDFGLQGNIESRFGQTNKVRVRLSEPLIPSTHQVLKSSLSKALVLLPYKTYFFKSGPNKQKLLQ